MNFFFILSAIKFYSVTDYNEWNLKVAYIFLLIINILIWILMQIILVIIINRASALNNNDKQVLEE